MLRVLLEVVFGLAAAGRGEPLDQRLRTGGSGPVPHFAQFGSAGWPSPL